MDCCPVGHCFRSAHDWVWPMPPTIDTKLLKTMMVAPGRSPSDCVLGTLAAGCGLRTMGRPICFWWATDPGFGHAIGCCPSMVLLARQIWILLGGGAGPHQWVTAAQ
ncbi:hypothetical protein ACLOJK_014688 [Asimina triloba]